MSRFDTLHKELTNVTQCKVTNFYLSTPHPIRTFLKLRLPTFIRIPVETIAPARKVDPSI